MRRGDEGAHVRDFCLVVFLIQSGWHVQHCFGRRGGSAIRAPSEIRGDDEKDEEEGEEKE